MNEMTRLYREGMAELRAENEQLKQRIAELESIKDIKNDALNSYAEFYDKCLDIIAMADTPHCQETDDIILGYVIKGFLTSPEVNNE